MVSNKIYFIKPFYHLFNFINFFLLSVLTTEGQQHIFLDSAVLLKELTVYSSRILTEQSKIGKNITILSGERFKNYPAYSLDEWLRYLPSIEIQSRGGFGIQSDITLRGSTFNQVLVLIDGIRINDPLTGHFNSNIPISPFEIAQVEIIRGASSAAFGADAVGGVVHIITKAFQKESIKDTLSGDIHLQYGQNRFLHSNVGFLSSKDRWKISGGFLYSVSDGQKLLADSIKSDFDLKTISLSATYRDTKFSLSLRTALDQRTFNAQYFYTNSPFDLSRERVNRWWNQGYLNYHLSAKQRLEFLWGYQITSDSFLFNPLGPANIHQTDYLTFQLNDYITFSNRIKLVFGWQSDRRNIVSSDRGNHQNWRNGWFGIGNFNVLANLYATLGLRLAYDESYRFEWLPQLDIVYHLGKLQIKGGISRSVRAPDFTERYISRNLETLEIGRNLGNPNLKAEKNWSYELGIQTGSIRRSLLKLTFFYRKSEDLVDYVITNERNIPSRDNIPIPNLEKNGNYHYAQNFATLSTYGYEIEYGFKRSLSRKLAFQTTLSLMQIGNNSNLDVISKYLASHSHFLITVSTLLLHPRFSWSLNGLWKERDMLQEDGIGAVLKRNYIVWNMKFFFHLKKNSISLIFQVQNLFNEQYADILGAKLPDRWITGGINWKF